MKFSLKQFIYMSIVVAGAICLGGCGDDTLGSDPAYSYDGTEQDQPSDVGVDENNNSSDHTGVKINKVPWDRRIIDFDDSLFRSDNDSSNIEDYKNNAYNDDNDSNDSNLDSSDQIGDDNSKEEEFENSKIVSVNGYKCYNVTKDICEIEYTIFKKTNEYRVARGLSQLKPNMALSATARSWSTSQSRMGYISHTGFPNSRNTILRGFDSDSTLDSREISFLSGENVAATGYSFSSNAAVGESFYTMWINSAGHRQNIVGSHTYLGVGVVKTSSGMYKFYATQIFGR